MIDRDVDPRAARASLALLGLSLAAFVVVEAVSGVARVHRGELFPYRHLPVAPLVPEGALYAEWALAIVAAAGLLSGRRVAWFVRAAALVACFSITQRFTNGRALVCIALVSLAIDPPTEGRSQAFGLLRAQLLLVYGMSVVHKLLDGFVAAPGVTGLLGVDAAWDRPLGALTLLLEVATPLALVLAPRVGLALAVVMHAGFSVALPFVAPFSLASLGLACLFVRPRDVATRSV